MNRTRPKQIVIRMTDEEFNTLKEKVDKSGMKQQEYLIKAITGKTITNTDGLKELTPELKRIGVNLNQIAKTCNQGNQASYDEIQRIGEELNEVWQSLRRLAQKPA
jgi:hypothetical protein